MFVLVGGQDGPAESANEGAGQGGGLGRRGLWRDVDCSTYNHRCPPKLL